MVGEREGDVDRHDDETIADTAESLLTFENAALPLAVVHPAGKIVMANLAMRTLLAYEFGALVGRSIYDVVVVADRDEFEQVWQERLRGGPRVTPERRMSIRCGDGSQVTVRASSVLVTDSQGAVRYVVARAVPERS